MRLVDNQPKVSKSDAAKQRLPLGADAEHELLIFDSDIYAAITVSASNTPQHIGSQISRDLWRR
jgi:hypothetical protein